MIIYLNSLKTDEGDKNCAILRYYTASSGNSLPTIQDNLSVPSSVSRIHGPIFKGQGCKTDSWKWDQYAVPKHQEGITTTCCVITQKSTVLIYFTAEVWNHADEGDCVTSINVLKQKEFMHWLPLQPGWYFTYITTISEVDKAVLNFFNVSYYLYVLVFLFSFNVHCLE